MLTLRLNFNFLLQLMVFFSPAWRLVPMFTKQQGAKELWQSTQKPHPQELTCLVTVWSSKKESLKERVSGFWENHDCDSTEEASLVQTPENFSRFSIICEKQNKFDKQILVFINYMGSNHSVSMSLTSSPFWRPSWISCWNSQWKPSDDLVKTLLKTLLIWLYW